MIKLRLFWRWTVIIIWDHAIFHVHPAGEQEMEKVKWRIGIDDGYVEYRYIVDINGNECINSVYEKIRKLFGSRRRDAVKRLETYPARGE